MVTTDDEKKSKIVVDPETEEAAPKVSNLAILRMNSPEWPLILLGTAAAAAMGALMPVFAFLFGEILGKGPSMKYVRPKMGIFDPPLPLVHIMTS